MKRPRMNGNQWLRNVQEQEVQWNRFTTPEVIDLADAVSAAAGVPSLCSRLPRAPSPDGGSCSIVPILDVLLINLTFRLLGQACLP
jgi:hypothetical protein